MAYFSVTNIRETTVYINVSGLGNAFNPDYYEYIGITDYEFPESDLTIAPDYTMGEVYPTSGSTNKYTGFQVTGLKAGTTYTFYCFSQAANGRYYPIYNSSSGSGLGITFTTAGGDGATFTVQLVDTDVRARITGYPSDAMYMHFFYRVKGSSTWIRDGYIEASSSYYYYKNLQPGKTYEFRGFYNAEESDSEYLEYDGSITIPFDIDYWSWTTANSTSTASASASTAQTKAAYTAITNKGYTTDFSYLVWNDFVEKVSEVATAAGYSWLTSSDSGNTYLTKANTKMTSSDRNITAARFNSLKFQIGHVYGTSIPDVSKGDTMYGSYFVTLASKLNDWIDSL